MPPTSNKNNKHNNKTDDDSDDDDEEGVLQGMHQFHSQKAGSSSGSGSTSNSISNYLVTSWRAVESAALHIPDASSEYAKSGGGAGQSAVYSRLGGTSTRSMRNMKPAASPKLGGGTTMNNEKTSLLESQQPKQDNDKHDASMPPPPPPPLMRWLWIALLCALAYALYNICIKKGSASIHPILGGVILQFVAATMGAVLLACMIWDPTKDAANTDKIHIERLGIYWSIGAGVWVGIAEITSFIVSGMGVPATQFIPINIGGSVVFGAILGVFLLGETVMLHGWSGVALLIGGIAMVATDPGEKVTEGGAGGMDENGGEDDDAPPLLVWIGPALFCALAYAMYNICIKKGSAYVNPIVGAVILQFVAAILGTVMLLVECWIITGTMPEATRQGIFWACMAGIFVGAAELLSFCVSGMGVAATQSIPIIIGGSVMFGAVLGIVMLGEELVLQGWMGVVVLMVGIGFVATDPGEKVEGH